MNELVEIGAARASANAIEEELSEREYDAVSKARAIGISWPQIGAALGYSRQNARQKYLGRIP